MAASRVNSNLEKDHRRTLTFAGEANHDDIEKELNESANEERIALDEREKVRSSNCRKDYERIRKVSKEREVRDENVEISDCERPEGAEGESKNSDEPEDRRSSKFQRQVRPDGRIRGLRKQARIVTTATIEDRTIEDASIIVNDEASDPKIRASIDSIDTRKNRVKKNLENHRMSKESTGKLSSRDRINDRSKDSLSDARNQVSPVKRSNGSTGRSKSQNDKDIEVPPLATSDKEKRNPKKCKNCGEQHFPYDRYSYLQKYSSYLEGELGAYERQDASAKIVLANSGPVRGGPISDSKLETPW
ncbi:hypothetical protein KPH14_010890 [Odynerus spinipes]|uniref:Uncharacterized protein n=1 Tax=Odynerus spinipes TaxID=1348599 RepID=A0AAD9RH47_9HYME|nr:hypothetical protein KPH14_010890 [Odynerus spinipes]